MSELIIIGLFFGLISTNKETIKMNLNNQLRTFTEQEWKLEIIGNNGVFILLLIAPTLPFCSFYMFVDKDVCYSPKCI